MDITITEPEDHEELARALRLLLVAQYGELVTLRGTATAVDVEFTSGLVARIAVSPLPHPVDHELTFSRN